MREYFADIVPGDASIGSVSGVEGALPVRDDVLDKELERFHEDRNVVSVFFFKAKRPGASQ